MPAGLLLHAASVAAIVVLGGEPERDEYAVQLARESPAVSVFVSSPGADAQERYASLEREHRLHISWDAVDTVTNFSTLYQLLLRAGITRVRLVTSPYHMPRALAIGRIMLGAGEFVLDPQPVPHGLEVPIEPSWKTWRDCKRAWIWRLTGMDFLWLARLAKNSLLVRVLLGLSLLGAFVGALSCVCVPLVRRRKSARQCMGRLSAQACGGDAEAFQRIA
eukprot:TRINITY_DN47590_c0_g1_i1.p1 TRINITY_DN47590_c0_g1~~TRINITY_DN47590_c0_g1_i1.p1  ORF type:complete len:220 (-),score=36.97 TRINITY_DN47590_c0_g1_i1:294-953(-)